MLPTMDYLCCLLGHPLAVSMVACVMQAELVAQFLCCIPLTTVDVVLSWLKPAVPAHEQEQLLAQVLSCSSNTAFA